MGNNKVNIQKKLLNCLTTKGKKNISEKLLLKSIKELQKTTKKQFSSLIKLAIIFSMPVFKIYNRINKKNKINKEIPATIVNKTIKISLAIKYILKSLRKKSKFYKGLRTEILTNAKQNNNESAVLLKNDIQKRILLKKFYFTYYK